MSVAKTPNLNLNLPAFNNSPWHDDVNDNFRSIDATIKSIFGIDSLKGGYVNSTAVLTGERYFDSSTGYYYEAQSDFTTEASPSTFAEERTLYASRWELLDAAAAIAAASNAATSATNAAASATTASTSATNASASATTATTKASEASASATNAATSATNAATSATNAAASAVTAANNAANVDISTALLKADNLAGLTNVTTAKTNLVLNNIDNTSDINKPVSTAQQSAIDAVSSSVTALDDSLGTLAYLDEVSGNQVGTLSRQLVVETGWPGIELKPSVSGGFGYIDFKKDDRPGQDFQFRQRTDANSEQIVFEHYDANDVYSHLYTLTGNGDVWTKSYGWLHDKFAAKDDGFTTIQEIGMGSPASSITFNNLSDYRELRLRFLLRPVNDNVHVFVRTSTNNGVNFDSGLSDYSWCRNFGYNGGSGADGYVNDGLFKITPGVRNYGGAFISGILHISQFNQNDICPISCEWTMREGSGNVLSATSGGFRKASVARDAMRMQFSAGDIASGYVRLEGLKS